MDNLTEPWQKLFGPPAAAHETTTFPMRLLRREGRAFLLLPAASRLAAQSLELYAPQTRWARLAKYLLRAAFNLDLPLRLETLALRINQEDPFARFLSQSARAENGPLPAFALLAGNPRVAGQRSILLLFDSYGAPAAVVKAGADPDGFRLIEREETFLKSVPPNTAGVPSVRSIFRSEGVRAFAMDFFPGKSPNPAQWPALENLLGSWIDCSRKVSLGDLPMWQRFEISVLVLPEPLKQLGSAAIYPAIYHGDFAPWNIKAQRNSWMLLDWERGELAGVPLWDWLHFIVQPAVLVEHSPPGIVIGRIENWLQSAPVTRYAERCGIAGLRRALTAAYFQYCIHVLRPTEGLPELQELGDVALRKWFPGVIAL